MTIFRSLHFYYINSRKEQLISLKFLSKHNEIKSEHELESLCFIASTEEICKLDAVII